jgi:hypothetical protein
MSDGASQTPANRLLFVGGHKTGGRAKGTYIQVVTADRVSVEVGVDGEGTYVDNGNKSATITILLTPSSKSNLVFSAYFATQLAFPIVLKEKNGTTAGACVRARFTKQADVAWSDGAEVRAWVAVTTNWSGIVGDLDSMELAEVDESEL